MFESNGAQMDYSSDAMDPTDHMGGASMANQQSALSAAKSHVRGLVMTWVFLVAVWWAIHIFFRGSLS